MRFVASFAEAWIEMFWTDKKITINLVASFAEAWIEITVSDATAIAVMSPPSRRRGLKFS